MADATPLIFPQLGPIYEAFLPWAETLLRAVVGLSLVPHGLRTAFRMAARARWSALKLSLCLRPLLVGACRRRKRCEAARVPTNPAAAGIFPLLVLTRPAACPIVIFLLVSN